MMFRDQPVRQNQAGDAGGGGGAPVAAVAPVAPVSQQSAEPPSWESLKAQAMGETPIEPGQAGQAGSQDPWALPQQPKPKIGSYAERVAARQAREVSKTYEQQLQATQAQLQQAQQTQQTQRAEYQRRLQQGDVDGALKALGAEDFATVQRYYLQGKGAIPAESADPHVQSLQRELQRVKAAEQQRQIQAQQQMQAQRQAQQRQQEQAQRAEDLQAINTDLQTIDTELPGASSLTQIPGFSETVLQLLEANPTATLADAARIVRRDFMAAYELMAKSLTPNQQAQQGFALPQAPPVSPIQQRLESQRRPPTAPAPLQGMNPDEMDPKEVWERIKNAAMNA
jgi:hypothetical protein